MQFLTEQRRQFQSLDPSENEASRTKLVSPLKVRGEGKKPKDAVVKTLKMFEVYNPESVNQAMKKQFLLQDKSKDQINKMKEYVEAKSMREIMAKAKLGNGIMEDEETLDRKGKRRLVPVHLIKYYKKLQELKD